MKEKNLKTTNKQQNKNQSKTKTKTRKKNPTKKMIAPMNNPYFIITGP